MRVKLDVGAMMPTRAHKTDAGYDLYSPEKHIVYAHDAVTIDTGVHLEIPEGYVGMIKSKSGLNINHGLVAEGVIDSGYTGSIAVKVYNHSPCPYIIHKGDKLTQIVILPILTPPLEEVADLEPSERGDKGFGSTGK